MLIFTKSYDYKEDKNIIASVNEGIFKVDFDLFEAIINHINWVKIIMYYLHMFPLLFLWLISFCSHIRTVLLKK